MNIPSEQKQKLPVRTQVSTVSDNLTCFITWHVSGPVHFRLRLFYSAQIPYNMVKCYIKSTMCMYIG